MDKEKGCNTCELVKDIKKYDEKNKEEPFATVILKAAVVSEIWKKRGVFGTGKLQGKGNEILPGVRAQIKEV